MNAFWGSFEKNALNAAKARQLAAKHGLVPEGAWKWGLRQLRKGKTKEQLGQAPRPLLDKVKRLGDEVEVGGFWGKGSRGRARLHVGHESGVDLGGELKSLLKNKDFMKVYGESRSQTGGDPKELLKLHGKVSGAYKRHIDKTKALNTIHTHPASNLKNGNKADLDIAKQIREVYKQSPEENPTYIRHPLKHRFDKLNKGTDLNIVNSIEKRHQSSHPELMPSGFKLRGPYNPRGMDQQRFLLSDLGVHHNIVTPGRGVGIHTVRPDKQTGEKKLRTLLFKEKTKSK